jgi:hypothetical protein
MDGPPRAAKGLNVKTTWIVRTKSGVGSWCGFYANKDAAEMAIDRIERFGDALGVFPNEELVALEVRESRDGYEELPALRRKGV